MKAVVVRWAPWVLLAAALVLFLFIPDASGVALAAIWGAVIVGLRLAIGFLPDRTGRLWADGLIALGCFLAAFEGGWYLLPAVLAFTYQDWRADPDARPRPLPRSRYELIAGLLAAGVGIVGLAFALWGPLYSTASSLVSGSSTLDGPVTTTNLFSAGLTTRAEVVLAIAVVLLVSVAAAAWLHASTGNRWARRVLGIAALGLAVIAVLGVLTIGGLLLPAVVLSGLAWLAGRGTQGQSAQ